jgi:hypothetical protein
MKNNYSWKNVKVMLAGKELPVKSVKYDESKEKNDVIYQLKQKESEVITNVLKQVLKREPTADDALKLTKIVKSEAANNYIIAFNGIELGRIYFDLVKNTVSFIPFKEFKQ